MHAAPSAALFCFAVTCPCLAPAQSPAAPETSSPAAILSQTTRYRVGDTGDLQPVRTPAVQSTPSTAPPQAPGYSPPPQPAIIYEVPRSPYAPGTGTQSGKAPAVEPERPTLLPSNDDAPDAPVNAFPPPPAVPDATGIETPPPMPRTRSRLTPTPEPTKRPGLIRRITGRIPIVGPAIVGDPDENKNSSPPRDARRPDMADDIMPPVDTPPFGMETPPPAPVGEVPVLLPPPDADIVRSSPAPGATPPIAPTAAVPAIVPGQPQPNFYSTPTQPTPVAPYLGSSSPTPRVAVDISTPVAAQTPQINIPATATPYGNAPATPGPTPAGGIFIAPNRAVSPPGVSQPVIQSEPAPPVTPSPSPVVTAPPAMAPGSTPVGMPPAAPTDADASAAPSAGVTAPTPVSTPFIIQAPAQPTPMGAPVPPFAATPAAVDPASSGTAGAYPAPPQTTPVAEVTSVTFEANDLAMPNPTVEPNEYVRSEYIAAVHEGRAGNYPAAAAGFRTYAVSHSASGLAPRALFLAVVFEADTARALETYRLLRETHPDSPYVAEADRRQLAVTQMPEYLPADVERYRAELAQSAGDAGRALEARRKLATALVARKDYAAAENEIQLGLTDAQGRPVEADFLDLLSETEMARRDTRASMETLTDLLQRFPYYRNRPKVRMNMGLVCEEAGFYPNALANYRYLIEETPNAPEATFARDRIKELERTGQ